MFPYLSSRFVCERRSMDVFIVASNDCRHRSYSPAMVLSSEANGATNHVLTIAVSMAYPGAAVQLSKSVATSLDGSRSR
jgi:hypothetical protein